MKRFLPMLATTLLLTVGAAQAHTHLESSMPADNAVLSSAPSELMLHFSEPTRLTSVTIQKEGAKDQQAISVLPKDASAAITVPIEPVGLGSYTVSWRAVGPDNHVMKGVLHFTVKVK